MALGPGRLQQVGQDRRRLTGKGRGRCGAGRQGGQAVGEPCSLVHARGEPVVSVTRRVRHAKRRPGGLGLDGEAAVPSVLHVATPVRSARKVEGNSGAFDGAVVPEGAPDSTQSPLNSYRPRLDAADRSAARQAGRVDGAGTGRIVRRSVQCRCDLVGSADCAGSPSLDQQESRARQSAGRSGVGSFQSVESRFRLEEGAS